MKTIKIFVASSKELSKERKELAALANSLNTALMTLGINVIMVEWENLDSSKGKEAKQDEYNKELCTCDLCIVLYATKFGEFTKIEFDIACKELDAQRNLKKLYVYFKDVPTISPDLQKFRDGYREEYGHYYSTFENCDMLIADFLRQFVIYESEYLMNFKLVEIRDSSVYLNDQKLLDLNRLPFVGNNQRYNDLQDRIIELQQDLQDYSPDHPRYKTKKDKLEELKKEREKLGEGLWEQALFIAKLGNSASADLLHRAIELFNDGDNKGAIAILNDEDIDRDIAHGLHLLEIGNEGKAILQTQLDKYRFKIKALKNQKDEGWFDKCIKLGEKILDVCVKAYGENSFATSLAHDELGQTWAMVNGYKAAKEFRLSLDILDNLNLNISIYYADVLGHLGRMCLKYDHTLLAEQKFKQALEVIRQVEVERYQYYVIALRNLGELYRNEMSRLDDAVDYFRQAEDVVKEHEGDKSLLYAELMSERAWVYLSKMNDGSMKPVQFMAGTDYYETITLFSHCLDILSISLDTNPSLYVKTLYDIGLTHYRANHFEEAEKVLKEALDLSQLKQFSSDYIQLTLQYVYDCQGLFEKSKMITYDYRNIYDNQRPSLSDSIKANKAKDKLMARKIAKIYLEKYPRPYSYGVDVVSTEDDSQGTFYHELNDEDLEILRGFVNRPEDEWDIGLEEWLESEQQDALIEKLLDFYSPFALNLLSDVDLEHPLKFTRFVIRYQLSDGSFTNPFYIGINLTDEEYEDLMSDLISSSNRYSVNMMVYQKPEIAQRIMSHIVNVFMDGVCEFREPFICDLFELKSVVKSILDPFEDKLHLFESENEDIRKYVRQHQVDPDGAGEEIYVEKKEGDSYHCVLNFDGPYMILHQEGANFSGDDVGLYDEDEFRFDARIALKKFGLEKPEKLFQYLKENFATHDCLSRVREFLMRQG